MEKRNARQLPEIYYCRHMETGPAKYADETILIDGDDLKKMIPTFAGKPVYVGHQTVDVDNLQLEADGYVTDSFYNKLDGWLWAKFIVVSDSGHKAVSDGWSVSNAYIPTEYGPGGTFHNVPFDRRITNGMFTHLALVPDPRYENAQVFTPEEFRAYQVDKQNKLNELQNSKGEPIMLKLFKNVREEVKSLDADTMVELQNGKTVSIKEMINVVEAAEKAEKANAKAKMNMDEEIEVGDEKMPLKDLINKYCASKKNAAKKNADDENAEKAEKAEKANDDEDDMENAEDEESDKKKKDDEKANSLALEKAKAAMEKAAADAYYKELKNAHNNAPATVTVNLGLDKLAIGRDRY